MLDYAVSVWKCRNFWLSLVANDLHLRYRRSVLGIGWSLLHPLATSLVLGFMFHEIFHRPIREYLPYLLCGLACWTYLTGAASSGCQTYIQAEPYIRQHPLPLAVYHIRRELEYGLTFYRNQLTLNYDWGRVPQQEHLLVAPENSQVEIAKLVAGRRVSYLGHYAAQHVDYFWVAAAGRASTR